MSPFVSDPALVGAGGRAVGVEMGAVYELVSLATGARAVINDPGDADFVGYLTEPPSGLERGGVRENAELIAEGDGGVHGAFYRDRLPFTLQGIINPNVEGVSAALAHDRLLRATRALRTDSVLRWVPSTISEGVEILFREQLPTRITGRRPKSFLVAGVAEDPLIYSRTLRSLLIDPGGQAQAGGFSSELTSPITSGAAIVGQGFAHNDGSGDVWPIIRILGPVANPVVTNATLGLALAFAFTLGAGEELHVETNPRRRRILYGLTGGNLVGRYSALNFPASTWWPLVPEANDIRLSSSTLGHQVILDWRDGWG